MELHFLSITVSIGLSLEVPQQVADRVQWTKAKEALQSDVSCSVRIPVMFNTRQLQRGDALRCWCPPGALASAGSSSGGDELRAPALAPALAPLLPPAPASAVTAAMVPPFEALPTAPASAVTAEMVPPLEAVVSAETTAPVPPVPAAASAARARGRGGARSKRGGRG